MNLQACKICGRPAPYRAALGDAHDWYCVTHTPEFSYPPELKESAINQLIEQLRCVARFIRMNGRKPNASDDIFCGDGCTAITKGLLEPLLAEVARLEQFAMALEDDLKRGKGEP